MLDIQKELEKFNSLLEDVELADDHVQPDVPQESDREEPAIIEDAVGNGAAVDASEITYGAPEDSEVSYAPVDDEAIEHNAADEAVGYTEADEVTIDFVVDEPADVAAEWTADLEPGIGDGAEVDPVAFPEHPASPDAEIPSVAGWPVDAPVPVVDQRVALSDDPAFDPSIYFAGGDTSARPWKITEHVRPVREPSEPAEPQWEDEQNDHPAEEEAPVEKPPTDLANEDSPREGHRRLSFPNLGIVQRESSGMSAPDRVGSLLHGARSALSGSRRSKSKLSPGLTVTLPEIDIVQEEEERFDFEDIRARILPLLNYRSGLFEDRLGMIVGAAAAFVVLVTGILFVPSMLSEDDPETEVIAASADTGADHLHASADPIIDGETTLSISTFPPGARVYLNADLIGVTPFQDIKVDRGTYRMSLEKSEYGAIDTTVIIDGTRDLFFDMSSASKTADIANVDDAAPATTLAEARVQEEPARRTTQDRIESSRRQVESPPPARQTRINSEEPQKRSSQTKSQPVQTGSLILTSEPMGATVFINDELIGETPATLTDVASGRVRLTMQKDGFVAYETEINIMPSIQTPFHAALARVKAALFVNASPGGDLYVDGALVRQAITPGHMEMVPVGFRNVRIVHPEYGSWENTIEVKDDGKATVEVDMVAFAYEWSVSNGDRLFSESQYQEAMEHYTRALSIRPGVSAIENKVALSAKAMAEVSNPGSDNRNSSVDGIYAVADEAPQLIGGLEALHSRVEYPQEAYEAGVQGRVYVQFVVDEDGRAQDITIAKGLPSGCNAAAIRAVSRSRFRPGTVGGVPVKVRSTVFVNFTIE